MSARGLSRGSISSEGLTKRLKNAIDEKLKTVKNQVLVDIVEGGVRIQIVDMEGSEMFAVGSDKPTGRAREVLKVVADNIRDIPNRIAIEGHTDASPFKGGRTTNWELSTARATNVLHYLVDFGVNQQQFQVAGFADTSPIASNDTPEGRAYNRRIDIVILSEGHQ